MCNREYYSRERRGFFPESDREAYEKSLLGWPSDAVEITAEYKEELFDKQAKGYEIVSDDDGYPVAVLNEPSIEETNKGQQLTLIAEADSIIQPMVGYALSGILSDTEKERFKAWNEYRKDLENVDITSDTVEWPIKPE